MAASGVLGHLKVLLSVDPKGFQKGLDDSKKGLQKFGQSMNRISDEMNRVFIRGLTASTAALTAFGAASAKIGSDFEAAMQFVGATANATGEEMVALEKEARNIGSTTLFSARQAAEGMTEFARAGMTTNEIIGASRPAMLLAGATMTDMATATQGMSATLRQFGLDTSESTRVTDVLALATRRSLFNLTGLLTAMKYGGPQARAYGMSLEEAVAAMMEFRNIGLEAHQAGVYFRMMLAKTGKVTPEAEKELKKYGLTTGDISLKTNSFAEILKNLAEADIPKAAGAMERIFGVRAGPVVQVLVENMKQGKDQFDEYTSSLIAAGGTTEDMYNRILDTVQAQFTIMKSAFEELMIVIFQTYGEALKEFFTQLAETIQFTAEQLQKSEDLGAGLVGILQNATDWMNNNQAQFAAAVAQTIDAIAALAQVIIFLLRHSRELLAVLAAVFVASKVHAYTAALAALIPVITGVAKSILAVRTAIQAVQVALTVTTGGAFKVITTITAGLVTLISMLSIIPGASDDAASALDKILAKEEERKKKQKEGYAETANQSKDFVEQLRRELVATDDLDQTTDSHLKHLEQMTDDQMALNIEGGKWVELLIDGEKYTLSQAAVMDIYNKGTERGHQLHTALNQKLNEEKSALFKLQSQTENMAQKQEHYNHLIRHSVGSWKAQADLRAKFFKQFKVELDQATDQITANNRKIEADRQRVAAQERVNFDEQRRLQRQELAETKKTAKQKIAADQRVSDEHKKLINKRMKAQLKLVEFERKLAREKILLDSQGLLARRHALLAELEEHQKLVDENSKLYKEDSANQLMIHRDAGRTRNAIMSKALSESANEMLKIREDLQQEDLELAALTAEEKRKVQYEKELADLKKLHDQQRAMFDGQKEYKELVDFDYAKAKAKLEETQALREKAIQAQKRQEFREQLEQESEDLAKSLMGPRLNLQLEYEKRIAEMRENFASKEQIKIAQNVFKLKVAQLAREEHAILNSVKERGRKATRLEQLSEMRGFGLFKKFLKSRAAMKERQHKLDQKRREFGNMKWALSAEQRELIEKELANESHAIWKEKTAKVIKTIGDIGKAIAATIKGMTAIAKKGAETFGFFTGFEFNLRSIVEEFAAASAEMATKGGSMDIRAEAAKKVSELVNNATGFMRMAVAAVPALLQELTQQLPELFDEFVEMVPAIIQGFADNIGNLVKVIVDNIPAMLTAVLSALPNLATVLAEAITEIVKAIPAILDAIIAELPMILDALLAGFVQIILQLADTLPVVIDQIVSVIPIVLEALIAALPALIPALIRLALRLVVSVLEAIPTIIEHVLEAIPLLIAGLVEALPQIIIEIAAMLPKLFGAIVQLIPRIIIAIIKLIPMIIAHLFQAIFEELIPAIPKIVTAIVKSALLAIVQGIEKVGQAIGDLFRSKKGKKKAKERRSQREADREADIQEDLVGDMGLSDFYSGINYVPSNMRVNVHQGEAIIPADRNPARSRGGAQQPLAGAGGMGSMGQGAPIDIAIMAEGRLLDAVQITAMRRGNAPGISKQLTRASGVTVGLDRGRFNYWTKTS